MDTDTNNRNSKTTKATEWLPFALLAVIVVAYGPLLISFGSRLWKAEHYSFVPLYLIVMAGFAYNRMRADGPFKPHYTAGSTAKWVLPILILAIGVWLRRPWFAGVSFIFALRALAHTIGGKELFQSVRSVWWCLWLCIPLPLNLDVGLIVELQHFASRMASRIFDWQGVPHQLSGVLLKFPQKTFEIEKACSGIQSLYASIAAGLIYSIAMQRTFMRTITLVASCFFWVLVMNIVRIRVVVVAEIRWDIPLGEGLAHDLMGYAVFVLTVLAVMSTDRMILFMLPEHSGMTSGRANNPAGLRARFASFGRRNVSPLPTVGTICILFLGIITLHFATAPAAAKPLKTSGSGLQIAEDVLPKDIDGWKRTSFERIERNNSHLLGEISQRWGYSKNGAPDTVVAVDGPFREWHDLGYCYKATGWTLSYSRDTAEEILGEKTVISELSMEDGTGRFGQVAFTVFEIDGRPVAPPPMRLAATTGVRLQGGIADLLTRNVNTDGAEVYCVQAYTDGPTGFSSAEATEQRQLLAKVITRLRSELSVE
jgi:exosortase